VAAEHTRVSSNPCYLQQHFQHDALPLPPTVLLWFYYFRLNIIVGSTTAVRLSIYSMYSIHWVSINSICLGLASRHELVETGYMHGLN
jgi:hypothetical protein